MGSYGNKAGYRIFQGVISVFGVNPAYFVLVFVIAYYVCARPSAYRAASFFLKRRFLHRSWLTKIWLTYKYYYKFGQCLIDQAAQNILGQEKVTIDFPEAEKLKDLASEGRGIVFLTSHVGVWQQAISTLGFIGRKVFLHLREEIHSQTMGLANISNSDVEIQVVSPDDFLGGVPQLSMALIRKNLVAVMGDRLYAKESSLPNEFLGEEAYFPLLPYHLGLSTNSDLIMFLTTRLGKQHFLFETKIKRITEDLLQMDKNEARLDLMKWYVKNLEGHIEKYPFMWFNFVDVWKK